MRGMGSEQPLERLGRYQLVRKLATGGMAEVFLARSEGPMGFEKTFVLKRILPHLAQSKGFVEMFLSEARLAALLNHPNLVQVFELGEDGGNYFLAMEYIEGLNLRSISKRAQLKGRTWSHPLVAKMGAWVCEGLAYAHEFAHPTTGEKLHLVHRDISPDNIMMSRSGAVKVLDFGIAKAVGQLHHTQSGVLKGKISYMSPEQLLAQPVDHRADIFSLGAVLFELVTGERPFAGNSDALLMKAIVQADARPARQLNPEVPEALAEVLDKALAKSPSQRYGSCREMQADLEKYVAAQEEPASSVELAAWVSEMMVPSPGEQLGALSNGSKSKPGSRPGSIPSLVSAPSSPAAAAVATPIAHGDVTVPSYAMPSPPPASGEVPVEATAPQFTLAGPQSILIPAQPTRLMPDEPRPFGPAPTSAAATAVARAPSRASGPALHAVPTPMPAPPPKRQLAAWALAGAGGVAVLAFLTFALWPAAPVPAEPPKPRPLPTLVAPAQEPAPVQAPAPVAAAEPAAPTDPEPAPPEAAAAPVTPPRRADPAKAQIERALNAKPSRAKATGQLEVRVRPYAKVVIGNKAMGTTPLGAITLPEGKHTVTLINPDLDRQITVQVVVKANETAVIKHNFNDEPAPSY